MFFNIALSGYNAGIVYKNTEIQVPLCDAVLINAE